ncbi:uncharacterized protein LOC143805518 [Ranitomeya variabilis]|uniref:uncharacterized protein LOC143805518 n=1 Tax=Ranitomeya variabilis TaxID=490064 RepID=UPI0040579BFE
MSDNNLAEVENIHLYGRPDCAETMEEESFTVLKPSKTLIADSGLKEDDSHSEVDIPPSECEQYFSTPVQSVHKGGSCVLDLHENPSGYKSFFSLECNEIIQQLKSKAAQGWSASKRKLEELDISTIEAEPLPLLYCTPKSVLDEITCSAKRRRIDYKGDTEHISVLSSLIKHKSPGLGKSSAQCMVKIRNYVLNRNKSAHRNSTQEKCRPHFISVGRIKRSLFVRKSRMAHPQSSLLAKGEKSVPRERKSEPWIHKEGNFHSCESPTPVLEFRSFFAAECDRICKQLKRHNTERIMFSNVSSIEAEPPPDLSATINSTITLQLGSTCSENSVGVGQLDLEKMNINYSKTNVILQTVPDKMVQDTYRGFVKTHEVANATQEINNEASADGAQREIQTMHNRCPIADVTQEISTMHVMVNKAKATQDIIKMQREMSLSPADASRANVSMSNGVPGIIHDNVEAPNTLPVVNATQDIIAGDVSIAHVTQVITVGDWSERNAVQDSVTCSKAPVPEDPTGAGSNYSIANYTKDIGEISNASPAVEATQTIGTICCKNSTADATLRVKGTINEECATAETLEMGGKLSEVDVMVDTGTMWDTGIGPDNKNTNIFHARSQNPAQRNLVAADVPLQNVTLIKPDANVINCLKNIVSVYPEITPDSAIYKTFTRYKVAEPNVTYDVSVNRGTARNGVQDWTRLISHKDASNIPPDIDVIEKPKMNATHTIMSICNEITGIDSGDLTKVIATNCTVFDLSKNVDCQIDQPDKQGRPMWPITALALSSPRRSLCNLTDLTYNLDLTNIARDENVFYNRPIQFTTSTPLPSLGNPIFIKKSCGLPVNSKPKIISNQPDEINNITLEQITVTPQISRQSLAVEARIKGRTSQDVQYPKILKRATQKVMASRMPQPTPRSTLALSVIKMPQITSVGALHKDPGALGRTHMRPPLAPSNLPRKTILHDQPSKGGASSIIRQQQTPVTSKDFFKKRIDVPPFPASSLVKPPSGLSTQIYAGKVQSGPGPLSAARSCKVPSLNPSSGSDPAWSVQKEHAFIRPSNLVGSQIPSKMKPRASGVPVRKPQEAHLQPNKLLK